MAAAVPPAGPLGPPPGFAPPPAELAAALGRLGNLRNNINTLHTRSADFRRELQTRLQDIEHRVVAITAAMPNLAGARAALRELQHQVVLALPPPAAAHLQAVIDSLAHDQLQQDLTALQNAVVALETAVGVPPLHQPPATDPFPAIPAYAGGHKYTARSRSARAKRLKTRKRLHSLHPTRRHRRRRKHKKRGHKKRTHRHRRRKRRR